VSSAGGNDRKGMKPTDWTFPVGLPTSQVYQVLFALASGDVRRPLRGVREIQPLGDGRSTWFADPRGRPMKLSVAVTGQSAYDSISLTATGKGIEAAVEVTLRGLDANSCECSLTLHRRLSFAFEFIAGPALKTQHDRIGREMAPALQDIAKDYPEFAGGGGADDTPG
jgi:hypothetical protein